MRNLAVLAAPIAALASPPGVRQETAAASVHVAKFRNHVKAVMVTPGGRS